MLCSLRRTFSKTTQTNNISLIDLQMNKHIFLMGAAAAMLLASCSNDDLVGGNGNGQTVGNSDVPIMLSAGQTANKTRATLGNVDADGNYDGTFDADGLGFYCLATGKIAGTESITWREGYDNPNFLWMQNVKTKAETTDDAELGKKVTNLKFYDAAGENPGTYYFYPMGSQYSYTFYSYYPYSNNVQHNGNKYTIEVNNLDGHTDLIWGKSFVNADDPDAKDAYSAKYIRDKKKRSEEAGGDWNVDYKKALPQVTFKHKLMKFNIILKKGSGESTNLNKLGIKSAKLLNVATGGTLTIADLDNRLAALSDPSTDDNGNVKEGTFTVDWTTAANTNTDATGLELKTADDKDLNDAVEGYPGPFLGDDDQVTIGGGFLIPVPVRNEDGTYVDNGYAGTDNAELANKGIFRLRIDYFMTDNPGVIYKAAQYEIRPVFKGVTEGEEAWQEGYEYDIVISVSDPQAIQTVGYLTPWNKRTIELE